MLIPETHLKNKNYIKIYGYNFYDTKHSDGKAHRGTGKLIRKSIRHYGLAQVYEKYLEATSVNIFIEQSKLFVSAF